MPNGSRTTLRPWSHVRLGPVCPILLVAGPPFASADVPVGWLTREAISVPRGTKFQNNTFDPPVECQSSHQPATIVLICFGDGECSFVFGCNHCCCSPYIDHGSFHQSVVHKFLHLPHGWPAVSPRDLMVPSWKSAMCVWDCYLLHTLLRPYLNMIELLVNIA